MVKAVFVDIDGTLVDKQKKVSEETIQAIKKAQSKGIEVIICSGRHRLSGKTFQKICNMSRYIISNNGAEIYDCEANEVLYESQIDSTVCKEFYKMAITEDFVIKFSFRFGMATNKQEYMDCYDVELQEDVVPFLNQNKIYEISIGSQRKEKIEKLKKQIEQNPNIKVANERIDKSSEKEIYFIHCTNTNVSKGNAMAGLCKYLKIDLKDVVAIGNGKNDVSMIKMAGLGVAMENAPDDIKKIADMVTSSNEENGVAKVLEKILEEE